MDRRSRQRGSRRFPRGNPNNVGFSESNIVYPPPLTDEQQATAQIAAEATGTGQGNEAAMSVGAAQAFAEESGAAMSFGAAAARTVLAAPGEAQLLAEEDSEDEAQSVSLLPANREAEASPPPAETILTRWENPEAVSIDIPPSSMLNYETVYGHLAGPNKRNRLQRWGDNTGRIWSWAVNAHYYGIHSLGYISVFVPIFLFFNIDRIFSTETEKHESGFTHDTTRDSLRNEFITICCTILSAALLWGLYRYKVGESTYDEHRFADIFEELPVLINDNQQLQLLTNPAPHEVKACHDWWEGLLKYLVTQRHYHAARHVLVAFRKQFPYAPPTDRFIEGAESDMEAVTPVDRIFARSRGIATDQIGAELARLASRAEVLSDRDDLRFNRGTRSRLADIGVTYDATQRQEPQVAPAELVARVPASGMAAAMTEGAGEELRPRATFLALLPNVKRRLEPPRQVFGDDLYDLPLSSGGEVILSSGIKLKLPGWDNLSAESREQASQQLPARPEQELPIEVYVGDMMMRLTAETRYLLMNPNGLRLKDDPVKLLTKFLRGVGGDPRKLDVVVEGVSQEALLLDQLRSRALMIAHLIRDFYRDGVRHHDVEYCHTIDPIVSQAFAELSARVQAWRIYELLSGGKEDIGKHLVSSLLHDERYFTPEKWAAFIDHYLKFVRTKSQDDTPEAIQMREQIAAEHFTWIMESAPAMMRFCQQNPKQVAEVIGRLTRYSDPLLDQNDQQLIDDNIAALKELSTIRLREATVAGKLGRLSNEYKIEASIARRPQESDKDYLTRIEKLIDEVKQKDNESEVDYHYRLQDLCIRLDKERLRGYPIGDEKDVAIIALSATNPDTNVELNKQIDAARLRMAARARSRAKHGITVRAKAFTRAHQLLWSLDNDTLTKVLNAMFEKEQGRAFNKLFQDVPLEEITKHCPITGNLALFNFLAKSHANGAAELLVQYLIKLYLHDNRYEGAIHRFLLRHPNGYTNPQIFIKELDVRSTLFQAGKYSEAARKKARAFFAAQALKLMHTTKPFDEEILIQNYATIIERFWPGFTDLTQVIHEMKPHLSHDLGPIISPVLARWIKRGDPQEKVAVFNMLARDRNPQRLDDHLGLREHYSLFNAVCDYANLAYPNNPDLSIERFERAAQMCHQERWVSDDDAVNPQTYIAIRATIVAHLWLQALTHPYADDDERSDALLQVYQRFYGDSEDTEVNPFPRLIDGFFEAFQQMAPDLCDFVQDEGKNYQVNISKEDQLVEQRWQILRLLFRRVRHFRIDRPEHEGDAQALQGRLHFSCLLKENVAGNIFASAAEDKRLHCMFDLLRAMFINKVHYYDNDMFDGELLLQLIEKICEPDFHWGIVDSEQQVEHIENVRALLVATSIKAYLFQHSSNGRAEQEAHCYRCEISGVLQAYANHFPDSTGESNQYNIARAFLQLQAVVERLRIRMHYQDIVGIDSDALLGKLIQHGQLIHNQLEYPMVWALVKRSVREEAYRIEQGDFQVSESDRTQIDGAAALLMEHLIVEQVRLAEPERRQAFLLLIRESTFVPEQAVDTHMIGYMIAACLHACQQELRKRNYDDGAVLVVMLDILEAFDERINDTFETLEVLRKSFTQMQYRVHFNQLIGLLPQYILCKANRPMQYIWQRQYYINRAWYLMSWLLPALMTNQHHYVMDWLSALSQLGDIQYQSHDGMPDYNLLSNISPDYNTYEKLLANMVYYFFKNYHQGYTGCDRFAKTLKLVLDKNPTITMIRLWDALIDRRKTVRNMKQYFSVLGLYLEYLKKPAGINSFIASLFSVSSQSTEQQQRSAIGEMLNLFNPDFQGADWSNIGSAARRQITTLFHTLNMPHQFIQWLNGKYGVSYDAFADPVDHGEQNGSEVRVEITINDDKDSERLPLLGGGRARPPLRTSSL